MSDDLTRNLPDNNLTRLTLETVLERINLLNRDFLTIRADQEHLLQRIEGLESKAT